MTALPAAMPIMRNRERRLIGAKTCSDIPLPLRCPSLAGSRAGIPLRLHGHLPAAVFLKGVAMLESSRPGEFLTQGQEGRQPGK